MPGPVPGACEVPLDFGDGPIAGWLAVVSVFNVTGNGDSQTDPLPVLFEDFPVCEFEPGRFEDDCVAVAIGAVFIQVGPAKAGTSRTVFAPIDAEFSCRVGIVDLNRTP